MNCFSTSRLLLLVTCGALGGACGTQVADPEVSADPLRYDMHFIVEPRPAEGLVDVTLRLEQPRSLLRELRLRTNERMLTMRGDGEITADGSLTRWQPPPTGGVLRWQVAVAHRRYGDGYDAWLGTDFGLFRAEDIVPRASSRTLKGARSHSTVSFTMPPGWSVITQYQGSEHIRIDNPATRLDLPSGWIVMGALGVRRETIAGMHVAVAGPAGHGIRRLDILALLNWTVPELARILPELPQRMTIVSAGDPMWRGGLSAPQSLFVHADRPLLSENATSTLLHEIMHLSLGLGSVDGYDWIVEGLAEFYSLELLRRSGTISQERYAGAHADLAAWAEDASRLCAKTSTGARTALAVIVLARLDQEIADKTAGESSLDDVTRELLRDNRDLDLARLIAAAEKILGHKADALHSRYLPGCRSIDPTPATG